MVATITELPGRLRDSFADRPVWVRWLAGIIATAVVYWVASQFFLPRKVPLGVVLLGALLGTVTALLAMGLILLYRSDRIINFAYGSMGGVAAILGVQLYLREHWNYFTAMGVGLAAGIVLGGVIERLIIRRFANASRLILTVATIGLLQVLGALEIKIPEWFGGNGLAQSGFDTPPHVSFTVGVVTFHAYDVLIAASVPVVILGITWFLLRTDAGIAIRAAAENRDRALLLGIPVKRLSTLVWMVAGGLAALTVILKAPHTGLVSGAETGPAVLLPALAAAVIARMESLPIALVAGIGIGVVEQTTLWQAPHVKPSTVDVIELGVILVALLAQHQRLSRAEDIGSSSWSLAGVIRPIPRELRRLPEVVGTKWLLGIGALAVAISFPYWNSGSQTLLYSITLIYVAVAVSLVVLTGWGGNISLGQYGFVGAGAIVAGDLVMKSHADLIVGLLLAGATGAVVALVLGLPALRIRGQFLAVTTLAFAIAMDSFFLNTTVFPKAIPENVDRPLLFGRWALESDRTMFWLCLAFAVLAIIAVQGVRSARAGRVQLATRDNSRAAEAMAVPTTRARLAGFLLAGTIAGVAGGLEVLLLHGARDGSFPPSQSILVFSMAVIGGLGSVTGAILGVLAIRLAADKAPSTQLILSGAALLAILWILPGGIGEALGRIRDRLLRLVANRRGILVPSLVADRKDVTAEEDHAPDEAGLLAGALEPLEYAGSAAGTGNGRAPRTTVGRDG
jgi:branched-chain amino acid transport system permease protein